MPFSRSYRYLGISLCLLVVACSSTPKAPPAPPPERLLLQQVSANAAIIKWRGQAREACLGSSVEALARNSGRNCTQAVSTAGGHWEARFEDLEPDRAYYYSLGGLIEEQFTFRTAPKSGSVPADGNTRIWLIGDSGTASERHLLTGEPTHPGEAAAVYQGYKHYIDSTGGEQTDLFLLLGDNAYAEGTDAQWQESLFEVYPELLAQTGVWPTIGNHEMGAAPIDICPFRSVPQCEDGPVVLNMGGISTSSDHASFDGDRDGKPDGTGMPYLDIFTLPTKSEAGGVASGTEQYYSFDYGNIHVVSLDSHLTARDELKRNAMRTWLRADLEANSLDWTIVIFHHPPYSKGGNHDSDIIEGNVIDRPQIDMREEFTPLFEAHGVDVVYSGHSHSYERSYYLRGHRGTSDSYSHKEHAELVRGSTEQPSLGQSSSSYSQLSPTSGGIDDRVVYSVAGSSGKADHGSGLTDPDVWLRHPAHIKQPADPLGRNGLAVIGSVVIDASASELTARFIDDKGVVLDHFVITR
jgi:Calcineurin-like phosphoesterase